MHSLNRKSCRAPKFHRILTKSADLLFNPGRIGENPPKAMEVKLCRRKSSKGNGSKTMFHLPWSYEEL